MNSSLLRFRLRSGWCVAAALGLAIALALPAQAQIRIYVSRGNCETAAASGAACEAAGGVLARLRMRAAYQVADYGDLLTTAALCGAAQPGNFCADSLTAQCRAQLLEQRVSYYVAAKPAAGGPERLQTAVVVFDRSEEIGGADFAVENGETAAAAEHAAAWINKTILGHAGAAEQAPGSAAHLRQQGTVLPERRLQWTWLGAGATVTTALAATLVGINASNKEDKFHEQTAQAKQEPTTASLVTSLQDKAVSDARLANVLWIGTGVFAVTTLVVFLLEHNSVPEQPGSGSPRADVTLLPGRAPQAALKIGF